MLPAQTTDLVYSIVFLSRLQGRSLSFQDVLDHAASTRLVGYACTTAATAAPLMDSFALRHLVFKSPERVQPLSSMLLEQQHR